TSLDDDRHDYYAIGSYDELNAKWVPDNPGNDVGIGITYDYRIFYASKVFYDQSKQRRVLWGWIGESDSEATDVRKGWASLRFCKNLQMALTARIQHPYVVEYKEAWVEK
ncbi:Acid beta-fructofuranosidase 2, vacuolar, partial [Linum perenne]